MGLYDDLRTQKYLDPVYGTVSNVCYGTVTSGFNCLNPSLFSAEASTLLGWQITGWPMYPKFLRASALGSGIYTRYPDYTGNTSEDETMAQATLSAGAAQNILNYAREHGWVFDPQGVKWDWKHPVTSFTTLWGNWLGRFIWLRPYVKFCVVFRMNWIDQILWSVPCCLSAMSAQGDTSGKLLFWVMSRFIMKANRQPWLCRQAIRFWNWRMSGEYEGGVAEVMSIYFTDPNHPFHKYAPKDFK